MKVVPLPCKWLDLRIRLDDHVKWCSHLQLEMHFCSKYIDTQIKCIYIYTFNYERV